MFVETLSSPGLSLQQRNSKEKQPFLRSWLLHWLFYFSFRALQVTFLCQWSCPGQTASSRGTRQHPQLEEAAGEKDPEVHRLNLSINAVKNFHLSHTIIQGSETCPVTYVLITVLCSKSCTEDSVPPKPKRQRAAGDWLTRCVVVCVVSACVLLTVLLF